MFFCLGNVHFAMIRIYEPSSAVCQDFVSTLQRFNDLTPFAICSSNRAIGFARPVAGPLLSFAQQRPQASPQPAVRTAQARAMACSEVAVPAPQDRIHLRKDLAQATSLGAPRQRSHFL